MKKGSIFILASFILVLTTLQLVSAYGNFYIDLRYGSQQVIQWVQDFATPFFEVILDSNYDQYFFSKVLLLILLFAVLMTILEKVPLFEGKGGIKFIISITISIISMRYIGETQLIEGIILPYSILAIAIYNALVLLIFGYFIHGAVKSPAGRRLGWGLYLAIFIGIWYDRYTELSPGANRAYGIFCLIIALGIILDPIIQKYIGLDEIKTARQSSLRNRITSLQAHHNNLLRNAPTPIPASYQRTLDDLQKEITKLTKKLR
jgi:hypothetical protein